jgi:DNA-binding GntR family transcriptional regulator
VKKNPSRKVKRRSSGSRGARTARTHALPRLSLVEQAYQNIRRRILDNEYPQGHQMLEHELASELGMSRTPVREALVRLETDKFVQLVPRHGMRVIPLELTDLRDMYEVLTALETTAIERLARSNPTSGAFVSLEQALDSMDRAVALGDHDGWVRADERFHRGLVELCGNPRLKALADVLWDQGHRARTTSVRLRQNLETSNAEHRAVVDAIRRGDWREAKALHVKHRARTSGEILDLLQKFRLARV